MRLIVLVFTRPGGDPREVELGTCGCFRGDLTPLLLGLTLVSLGGLPRTLDDLVGLRTRLGQPLAVFGQQLLGVLSGSLCAVDRVLDLFLTTIQRLGDARE